MKSEYAGADSALAGVVPAFFFLLPIFVIFIKEKQMKE